jgi:hypothetical protein
MPFVHQFCIHFHVQLPSTLSKYSLIFSFFSRYLVLYLFDYFLHVYVYTYLYIHSFLLCTRHHITPMVKITITINISSFSLLFHVLQFLHIGTALYYIATKLNTTLRAGMHSMVFIHMSI